MSEHVTLTMTRDQAAVVERACELLSRLHIGQFDMITQELMHYDKSESWFKRRDTADGLMNMAAQVIFGKNSYGQPDVKEKDIDSMRAWTVYTTLRYARMWHDYPEGGTGVSWDKPLAYGEEMPSCMITNKES